MGEGGREGGREGDGRGREGGREGDGRGREGGREGDGRGREMGKGGREGGREMGEGGREGGRNKTSMNSAPENSCISPDVQFEERFITGQGLQDDGCLVTEVRVSQT